MAAAVARRIVLLLIVITLLLVSLAPWGPIETRSFEHLSSAVYWGFNALLILLGPGSFVAAHRLWSGNTDAPFVAVIAGVPYIAVHGLNLTGILPTSLGATLPLLFAIEVVDTTLAVMLIVYSYWVWNRANLHRGRDEARTS